MQQICRQKKPFSAASRHTENGNLHKHFINIRTLFYTLHIYFFFVNRKLFPLVRYEKNNWGTAWTAVPQFIENVF